MELLKFNLQLFAEGGEGTEPTGQPTGAAGEPSSTEPAANPQNLTPPDTLLGNGNEPTEPQVPESYDFTGAMKDVFGDSGQLDADVTENFTKLLKDVHATQDQAAAMAKFGMQYAQGVTNAVTQQLQDAYTQEVNGWLDDAKKDLGGQFDDTVAKAVTVRDYVEQKVPGFTQMLNLTGAGNHVAMIKAMSLLADLVTEDPGRSGNAGGSASGNIYDNTNWDNI